jgi:hypothetical protein
MDELVHHPLGRLYQLMGYETKDKNDCVYSLVNTPCIKLCLCEASGLSKLN